MVDPDFVAELATITAMYSGTVAGGFELLPESVVHVPPHVGGLVLVCAANPLKPAGAEPPLSWFDDHHCEPQNVIWLPTVVF